MALDDKAGSESSTEQMVDKTLDAPEQDTAITDLKADPAKEKSADSSDAQGDKDAKPLTSIVRDVVAAKKASEAKADTASPAEGQNEGSDSEKKAKEPDDENYSDAPFHKHPRFQHLFRRMKSYEQDATRYRNVETFLRNNALQSEEAADALVIAGLLKTNPVEAWKRLKPVVQNLLIAAGELVPDDLAPRVQAGELTREAAIEVARARASVGSMERQRQFEVQQQERSRMESHANALMGAAGDWEADRRKKDPNFEAKAKLLRAEVLDLQRTEGVPNTPEGVRGQLDKAYKAVVLPTPAPAPQAKRPIPAGSNASGNHAPAPTSTLDVVRATRAKMRGAA
jgi:hypothetical protein